MKYRFFDTASTTPCCPSASQLVQQFASEDFGNPSSSHVYGQRAAKAIREARLFFAQAFRVEPQQVIFTGSGSEADNLAVYGTALHALGCRQGSEKLRILASATDHPAVRKTVLSLSHLGMDPQLIPVDSKGQIRQDSFEELLTPSTLLVSIQQVNNITGAILPVEELAAFAKKRMPGVIFHTDAVQGFGKTRTVTAPSSVDLVSISGHKIKGPKGVGALIVLNPKLLKFGLRPLIWGGEQEGGFRSGTQHAGLIAGFHSAAQQALSQMEVQFEKVQKLQHLFKDALIQKELMSTTEENPKKIRWNSPSSAVPHIVSLSVPSYPTGPLTRLLEERGFLISTGSACSSNKAEPDAVLTAMGLPSTLHNFAIRVSFSDFIEEEDVRDLVDALAESLGIMSQLLGGKR